MKVWLIILTILYAIQAAFAVDAQRQINRLNDKLNSLRKKRYPAKLTKEYFQSIGINLSEEQYEELAELDLLSNGRYMAFDVLRLLQIMDLIKS